MNRLKRLETYLEAMKQRLDKESGKATGPKLDWIRLEIKRTMIDINNLKLGA